MNGGRFLGNPRVAVHGGRARREARQTAERRSATPRNIEIADAQLALIKACREESEHADLLEARLQRLEAQAASAWRHPMVAGAAWLLRKVRRALSKTHASTPHSPPAQGQSNAP